MAFFQRLLIAAFLPVIAILTAQTYYPETLQQIKDVFHPYLEDVPLYSSLVPPPLFNRHETPLIFTAFPHWSHYEKVAKVAVTLADLGYPVTFITGLIFEEDVKSLHPNITFVPLQGKPDKLTPEEYEQLATFVPGSNEQELFMLKKAMIDTIQDGLETLRQVFRHFRTKHGDRKPLLSFYDSLFGGHQAVVLDTKGPRPDTTFALGCHPVSSDSDDTFPFYMGKRPDTSPNAKAIHQEARNPEHMPFLARELTAAYWEEMQRLGVWDDSRPSPHFYDLMFTLPEHFMLCGVPEFEFPRSDLRPNVHYFGAIKSKKSKNTPPADLPEWWGDVATAKAAGKSIVAVSQGTVGLNLNDLLLPTLEALKDRDDVLVIATTVAVEVDEVPNLVVPDNARVAKFVPYDLLLPQIDVLVNNGGYGAVIQSLQAGLPMVLAGQGQDKNVTNTIVEWKEIGVNLGRMDPSVEEIREGVAKVLGDKKYKNNAVAMSKNFAKYDTGKVFDRVIQEAVRKWGKEQR